jgi:hypothetical protein
MQYWTLIGIALLATCLLALAALAVLFFDDRARLSRGPREPQGRFLIGIFVWFMLGLVAFSSMERLQQRYLEAFAPAVCAVLGLSLSVLWRGGFGGRATTGGARRAALLFRAAIVCVGVGLLALSLNKDSYVIKRARTDSLLTDFSTPSLSRYLRAHRDGTRYEVASANVNDVVGLVARDGQPVLILNSVDGSLTRTAELRTQVAEGHVHFYLLAPHACHEGRHCSGNQKWAFAHSVAVPGQPDLRRFTTP